MRFNRLFVFVLLCLCSLVAPVTASASEANYVQAQFLPPQLLPPPPAEGSAAWRSQIALVIQAQHKISLDDLAAMRAEQNLRVETITDTLGPSFNRQHLPKTFALLDRVMQDTGTISEADKKFWHTRRPYLTNARVKLYVDPIDASPAYPSGHTSGPRVLAEVLGMLEPEQLAALRARADAIARHRVEAGVHYPVDLEGGRLLAMLVIGALTANADFQDDLQAAREEMAAQ